MTIHATITGRLGAEPEMRTTANGTPMLRLRIASNHGWGDRETTTWVGCTLFGTRGERLASMLRKGSYVTIRGAVYETESQDGKKWLNCDVDDVDLPPRSVNEGPRSGGRSGGQASGGGQSYGGGAKGVDDGIPF